MAEGTGRLIVIVKTAVQVSGHLAVAIADSEMILHQAPAG